MRDRSVGLSVVLVALAFCAIAPSAASATNTPLLTYPTGVPLLAGSKFKGRNVGEFRTTNQGSVTLACSIIEMTGTVRKNTGSDIEADVESFALGGTGGVNHCTQPTSYQTDWVFTSATNGLPWCLRSTSTMKDDEVQIRGGACSGASRPIRVVLFTTFPELTVECLYERSGAMVGTYTTEPGDAIVSFSEVEWTFKSGNLF